MKKEEQTGDMANDVVSASDEMAARLEAAATRLETANKKFEHNKKVAEAERVEKKLAGESEAGIQPVKKEETPQEYAKRIMSGEL